MKNKSLVLRGLIIGSILGPAIMVIFNCLWLAPKYSFTVFLYSPFYFVVFAIQEAKAIPFGLLGVLTALLVTKYKEQLSLFKLSIVMLILGGVGGFISQAFSIYVGHIGQIKNLSDFLNYLFLLSNYPTWYWIPCLDIELTLFSPFCGIILSFLICVLI